VDEYSIITRFERWFVAPVAKLKELPEGDGGFAAFMIGLTLYERLLKARLKSNNRPTTDTEFFLEMQKDLRLTEYERSVFWATFRVGLLHQAMPKAGKTNWELRDEFSGYPEFRVQNGRSVIYINPWKFTDRVLQEFMENPRLIAVSESFPLAVIV
jgi:hypothetical protein